MKKQSTTVDPTSSSVVQVEPIIKDIDYEFAITADMIEEMPMDYFKRTMQRDD